MSPTGVSYSGEGPDPDDCRRASDVGRVHYNEADDIWYECVRDKRRKVITWAILPPTESPLE